MKITHIIGIVVIAIAIGVIISTSGNASAYVSFSEAQSMAADGNTNKIHVVGKLSKATDGQIKGMVYNPELDPNYFAFELTDQQGLTQKVIYANPKPQDFERSEQVVIIGGYQDKVFVADKILMKCPSKYQDNEFREAPKAAEASL
jgi:cytochrome c-type biogenesis protein CcmE